MYASLQKLYATAHNDAYLPHSLEMDAFYLQNQKLTVTIK